MTGDDDRHRPMIEVTNLVKNYGPVPAVRGVSLGVARGEVVVLTHGAAVLSLAVLADGRLASGGGVVSRRCESAMLYER